MAKKTNIDTIKEKIADLRAHGFGVVEIARQLMCSTDSLLRFGYFIKPFDLIAVILSFMEEKPGQAGVCEECPHRDETRDWQDKGGNIPQPLD